jgi:hypothetical protein
MMNIGFGSKAASQEFSSPVAAFGQKKHSTNQVAGYALACLI